MNWINYIECVLTGIVGVGLGDWFERREKRNRRTRSMAAHPSNFVPEWKEDIYKLNRAALSVEAEPLADWEKDLVDAHVHDWVWGRTFDMAISKKALYRRQCRTCQTEETITEKEFFDAIGRLGWSK